MRARTLVALLPAVVPIAAGCGAAAAPLGAPPPTTPTAMVMASPARSAPFAIVPDAPSRTVAARVVAGGVATLRVRVASASDAHRTLALSAGVPWIEVPGTVTVPARQSVAVTAVARPPGGTAPGVVRSAIVARASGDAGAPVAVSYASAAPVVLRVVPAPAP